MTVKMTIDERIEQLDPSLVGHVATTTPEEDRRTLLALQTVIRRVFPAYTYLEIGSYKGGSLQPYVVDPKCQKIISIDPRPGATPDVGRGTHYYPEFSVETMLEQLRGIPGADVSKIQTFEATSSDLNANQIGVRPQLCFVDGEHTDEAVLTDARFCLSVLGDSGAIAFHDANIVFKGLQSFLAELTQSGRSFRAHILPNFLFLIELGPVCFCEREPLRQQLQENYKAYLAGMLANDYYRQAYPLSLGRIVKELREPDQLGIYLAVRKVKRFFIKPKASKP